VGHGGMPGRAPAPAWASTMMTPESRPVTQVNLTMDNLEYVGDVTGSATQYYALGIPVGGRKYYTASVGGLNLTSVVSRGYNNALYDALMQKPDADFVLPLATEEKSNRMFLGRKQMITVRAKAFKIKSK